MRGVNRAAQKREPHIRELSGTSCENPSATATTIRVKFQAFCRQKVCAAFRKALTEKTGTKVPMPEPALRPEGIPSILNIDPIYPTQRTTTQQHTAVGVSYALPV